MTPETPLADAPLSARAKDGLHKMGVKVIGDIAQFTVVDLLKQKHLGRLSVRQIREVLQEAGLDLSGSTTYLGKATPKSRKEQDARRAAGLDRSTKRRISEEVQLHRIKEIGKPQPGVALAFANGVALLQFKDMFGDTTNVLTKLDILPGMGDRFGIPPHAHGDSVKLTGDFFADIREVERRHGPVAQIYSAVFRMLVDHVDAEKFYLCALLGAGMQAGVIVLEFDVPGPGQQLDGQAEHRHWFAGREPLPVQAALWIFENMTPALAYDSVERCNCLPPEPPMGLWPHPTAESHPPPVGAVAADPEHRQCPGLAACCEKPRGHEGLCETSRPTGIVPRCHNVDASDGSPCELPSGHDGSHLCRARLPLRLDYEDA